MNFLFSFPLLQTNPISPFSQNIDVENALESVIVKSISLGEDEVKTLFRNVSFNRCDEEPMVLKSLGSGKMTVETSVSF